MKYSYDISLPLTSKTIIMSQQQAGRKVSNSGGSGAAASGRLTASKPDEIVVVLVGDARVGKTCLATRFCEHIFIQVNNKEHYFHYLITICIFDIKINKCKY